MATETIDVLEELSPTAPLKVDREKGIIRGVKILGRHSKHGYTYGDNAQQKAKTLYENLSVNIDHPDKKTPDVVRPMADRFGKLKDCYVVLNGPVDAQGTYGDLHYLKSHPMAEQVCEAAERMPEQLGLSHNAAAIAAKGPDGKIVIDDLEFVRSVDIVSRAATNKTLFESDDTMTVATAAARNGKTNAKFRNRLTQLLTAAVTNALEDDGMSAVAADPAVTPVPQDIVDDVPDVADAIKILVNAIVDSDIEASVKGKLTKLVVDLQEKIEQAIEGGTDVEEEDDTEPEEEGMEAAPGQKTGNGAKTVLESGAGKGKPAKRAQTVTVKVPAAQATDPVVLELQESLAQVRKAQEDSDRKRSARDLMEEFSLPYEPGLVTALEAIGDEDKRRKLAESWPRQRMPVRKPKSGRPVLESSPGGDDPPQIPTTRDGLAAFLTAGRQPLFTG